jgi:hypothetical protein
MTELISELNEIVGKYKECADKLTMIASVNPDLAPIATDTAAMIVQRHDDAIAFINDIAAKITQINTPDVQTNSAGLEQTYQLLIRALDRKADHFNQNK